MASVTFSNVPGNSVLEVIEERRPAVQGATPVAGEATAQTSQETRERVLHEEQLQRALRPQEISQADMAKINACHTKVMQENVQKMRASLTRPIAEVKSELQGDVQKFDREATAEDKVLLEHLVKSQVVIMQQLGFSHLFTLMQQHFGFSSFEELSRAFLVSSIPQYTKEVKAISQLHVDNLKKIYGNEEAKQQLDRIRHEHATRQVSS